MSKENEGEEQLTFTNNIFGDYALTNLPYTYSTTTTAGVTILPSFYQDLFAKNHQYIKAITCDCGITYNSYQEFSDHLSPTVKNHYEINKVEDTTPIFDPKLEIFQDENADYYWTKGYTYIPSFITAINIELKEQDLEPILYKDVAHKIDRIWLKPSKVDPETLIEADPKDPQAKIYTRLALN